MQAAETSLYLQDEVLTRLDEEHIFEFLVTLASSLTDFRFAEWNLDLLDIFAGIFNDRDPTDLLGPNGQPGSKASILPNPSRSAQAAYKPSRHSRFGGAFTMKLGVGCNRRHKWHFGFGVKSFWFPSRTESP